MFGCVSKVIDLVEFDKASKQVQPVACYTCVFLSLVQVTVVGLSVMFCLSRAALVRTLSAT